MKQVRGSVRSVFRPVGGRPAAGGIEQSDSLW